MNLKRIITEIFDPRFSTEEIQNSKLKYGITFEVTDLFFDDEKPHFPTHILGVVKTQNGIRIQCSWNRHGECTHQGNRVKSFDLIRPTQGEIDSARTVGTSLMVFIVLIIISNLF